MSLSFLPGRTLACVALVLAPAFALESHWPQFRGVRGSGVNPTARPPVKFGPEENVRWRVAVPWSPSSPCLWEDRIFLTTFVDGKLETRCHDLADGRLRWSRTVQAAAIEEHHRSDGSPAASTPATDGRRVVSYFGSFGVICHDLDGHELWRHPLPVAQSMGKYGSGTSPILVGDTVVISRDQHQFASLLALDLTTGAKRWETPRIDSFGSFGSPAYWRNQDSDEIVLAGSMRLKGYDLRSGAERWVVEGVTGAVCTTPVAGDQMLYFGAWSNAAAENSVPPWEKFLATYDRNGDGIVQFEEIPEERRDYARGLDANRDGRYTREDWEIREVRHARAENSILAVKPGGTGDITESHVAWKFRKAIPYVPSPLLYEGRIYYIRDGGQVSSLDARTGEPFYAQEPIGSPGSYYASPVAADGRIYVASLAGKVSVIKAGGVKPEVLHRADFGSRILATPALAGNRIYVRTTTDLWAFGE